MENWWRDALAELWHTVYFYSITASKTLPTVSSTFKRVSWGMGVYARGLPFVFVQPYYVVPGKRWLDKRLMRSLGFGICSPVPAWSFSGIWLCTAKKSACIRDEAMAMGCT